MAAIRVAESGAALDLFSIVPVKRSHSVCAQGGINAAKNLKGEGDSAWKHFDDTIYGGDFLANQSLVKGMCEAAPQIIDLLDRMGVMFNRTPEGLLDFRRFGGTLYHRTAFAGATTGQQLLYALDEQVRRFESEGKVKKFEGWTFLSAVLDESNISRGICAMNLKTMEIKTFPADAVIFCTGGIGAVFGRSTNSVVCTGSAQSSLFQQGVYYANGEFIQVHPTAIPGEDKCRLMSESARGEGGRVWVPKKVGDTRGRAIPEGERFYFLEEWYPKYGNLVPRDVATRAIHKIVFEMKMGLAGDPAVYLDVSHIPRDVLDRKLEGILEIYEKFVGVDPHVEPMKVFPAMHYTMGGLWVDNENQATNIAGIFAAGECEYQYHGANRLGANSLVSCIYGGALAGPAAVKYARNLEKGCDAAPSSVYERERVRQQDMSDALLNQHQGTENPIVIWRELGDVMTENVTVIRYNPALEKTLAKIDELSERFTRINVSDRTQWANQTLNFIRELGNMLVLAKVITLGALARNESRGAHYKPDFPNRDDAGWLKTTKASFNGGNVKLEYEPVDTSLIQPRERKYTAKA
jgi:succinate dehydrogenase / fumarate reductase flavoprotein subunit